MQVAALKSASQSPAAATDVVTQHYDVQRTGWNSQETVLTTSNVTVRHFGLLHSVAVDDEVDAQPLLLTNQPISGVQGNRTVVYVATEGDTVYAIDARAALCSERRISERLYRSQCSAIATTIRSISGSTQRRSLTALLGQAAPVGGRVHLARGREQPQVDPLHDHVGARDLGVRGERALEVDVPAGDRGGVLAGHGARTALADRVVEQPHVGHDLLGRDRRPRREEVGLLHGAPEALRVVIQAQRLDHADEGIELRPG